MNVTMGEGPQEVVEEVKAEEVTAPIEQESVVELSEEPIDDTPPGGFTLDDFDESEEIWEGGPTVGQTKEWKKLYGRIVVGTLDNGDHYMIRPMNRFEYKNHVAKIENLSNAGTASNAQVTMTNEEGIATIGLLYPSIQAVLGNGGLAGLPTLLSQQIMEISGFMAIETREL